MPIALFADSATADFFLTGVPKRGIGWSSVASVVRRKLDMLHYAVQLQDLKSPPGNRLERLPGTMAGLHSIRINRKWRIVFRWTDAGPSEVKICDYH